MLCDKTLPLIILINENIDTRARLQYRSTLNIKVSSSYNHSQVMNDQLQDLQDQNESKKSMIR